MRIEPLAAAQWPSWERTMLAMGLSAATGLTGAVPRFVEVFCPYDYSMRQEDPEAYDRESNKL